MNLPDAATCAAESTQKRFPPDPDFYYRIDTLTALRAMRDELLFKPKRWDLHHDRWPHASLLATLEQKTGNEGIFRISFWINEQEGRAALETYGTERPYLLLRFRRSQVASALVS